MFNVDLPELAAGGELDYQLLIERSRVYALLSLYKRTHRAILAQHNLDPTMFYWDLELN